MSVNTTARATVRAVGGTPDEAIDALITRLRTDPKWRTWRPVVSTKISVDPGGSTRQLDGQPHTWSASLDVERTVGTA